MNCACLGQVSTVKLPYTLFSHPLPPAHNGSFARPKPQISGMPLIFPGTGLLPRQAALCCDFGLSLSPSTGTPPHKSKGQPFLAFPLSRKGYKMFQAQPKTGGEEGRFSSLGAAWGTLEGEGPPNVKQPSLNEKIGNRPRGGSSWLQSPLPPPSLVHSHRHTGRPEMSWPEAEEIPPCCFWQPSQAEPSAPWKAATQQFSYKGRGQFQVTYSSSSVISSPRRDSLRQESQAIGASWGLPSSNWGRSLQAIAGRLGIDRFHAAY